MTPSSSLQGFGWTLLVSAQIRSREGGGCRGSTALSVLSHPLPHRTFTEAISTGGLLNPCANLHRNVTNCMISFACTPPNLTLLPSFLVLKLEDVTGGILLMDSLLCLGTIV